MKKMTAEDVANLAQFVQVARKMMEERFGDLGLKLLDLDLGISGNKNVIVIPGAERYFLTGTVAHPMSQKFKEFRVDFAMSIGDTTIDTVAGIVNDVVTKTAPSFK